MRGPTGQSREPHFSARQSRESLIQDFVAWPAKHVTGDKKGQAQIFLDRPLQAFDQQGSFDVGGPYIAGYVNGVVILM